ncbi:hypothetical protein [Campylobacter helveticus]|nr:hypothetical protein [Campylobacter helveticus]
MWDTQDTYTDIDTFLLSTNKVNATSLSDLENTRSTSNARTQQK